MVERNEELRTLAALYVEALNEQADKMAAEADYQDGYPLIRADVMRKDAAATRGTLGGFIRWCETGKTP